MKTLRLTDTITQLTQYGFVNAYLVREDNGFTLVDTMLPRAGQALRAAAGAAGAPIRRIALTHGHGDHVGSLDELRDALGGDVKVLIPELDARILAGERVVEGKLTGSWPKVRTTPDVRLAAGDRVGSLEVVATPGHSPGHVSFLDTRDRALIAGDVFASVGQLNVSDHFYWRFPLPSFATYDPARDRESARALRALEPTLLAVGHGRATPTPTSAMDAALARAAG